MPLRPGPRSLRMLLVLAGVILSLAAAEFCVRVFAPVRTVGSGWQLGPAEPGHRPVFELDDELGYRPALDGPAFDATGTTRNGYPRAKRSGVERVLFVGDSVTQRHKIVDALRARYGETEFEFWNAGVSGYNTIQVVGYYERFNAAIEPDHVVLTFHNNDFQVTPVAFFDRDGTFHALTLDADPGSVSGWTFRHSHLYRLWIQWRGERSDDGETALRVADTEAALARLSERLQDDGIRLTVVLHPILRTLDEWSPAEVESRDRAIEIFERLGLRWIDLLEPLEAALAAGDDPSEEPGDTWHPSWAAADRFGAFLFERGLLRGPNVPAMRPATIDVRADRARISIAAGGVQRLEFDAGLEHAGRSYLVLGSATGREPPTRLHLVSVPLVQDAYFALTLAHPNTWIAGSYGELDRLGRAHAELRIPPGSGATPCILHHALVVFQPVPLTFYAASAAVALELVE